MTDIQRQILEAITAKPGQKAKDIASGLGLDRSTINSALHGILKTKVRQDRTYRWYPRVTVASNAAVVPEPQELNTALARLCRYYLDCISQDDLDGVSEFAASNFGLPSYVELTSLPGLDLDGIDPLDSEPARRLVQSVRRDRNRQTMFVGYPVRLRFIRARSGWEGYRVEPLLLFPCQDVDNRDANPILTEDPLQINFKALQGLSNTTDANLIEEAIDLSEELGLANTSVDQPELDEVLSRLCEIRSEWDWKEEIDPHAFSTGIPLSSLNEQGIYNRGILIAAERSPYTKGLEFELRSLQSVEESKQSGTALGAWLTNRVIDSPPPAYDPLIEVLPLNSEQRQAVRQALSNPLTVITGPPGTGKSQVVTSILVNAAHQGKTVLFASKNNKAVEVVETRVNALGPRPILLRLGPNQYQSRLAEYLASLLATSATESDHELYREYESIHAQLRQRSDALDIELQALVALRNEVDLIEQQVEPIRQQVGEDSFRRFGSGDFDLSKVRELAVPLRRAIQRATKIKQPIHIRLAWPFVRKARFERLAEAGKSFQPTSEDIGLRLPDVQRDSLFSVDAWIQYGARLETRISQAAAVADYFAKLNKLTKARSFEEISELRTALTDELAENSDLLWSTWLRLQPSRLSAEQRKLLGDYSALLQMIVSANTQQHQPGRDILRRYYQLFPKIASILPCWAVTSLSARGGRVPFEPQFFDLLVIDEASQCDIASALPLLFRARRVVVIGDPMQLKHISTLRKQQDQQLLAKHELLDDYPSWAYSVRSLFDLASSLCRSEDIVALRDHHRSHADIIGFSNKEFYENRLRVATNYERLLIPEHGQPAVRWIDVRGQTIRPSAGGALNEIEALAVVREIERLINHGYRGTIGVISPFRAQANRIRDLLHNNDDIAVQLANANFLSHTVHQFQGDERDVMIFSPAVSSGISDKTLGFLRNTPNLFNVAITRARAALIVVGDKSCALNCDVQYLARFAAHAERVSERTEVVGAILPPISSRNLLKLVLVFG